MTTPTPPAAHDPDLASAVDRALADVLRRAGRSLSTVPDDVAERHLAAITVLATEHAHTAARVPAPTWRSRMRRLAGLTIVKVAVGAGAAAAATTGGLAAGGHLPDPVQGAVADSVGWMGIDLPRPADDGPAADEVDSTPSPGMPAEAPADPPAGEGGDVAEVVSDPTPSPAAPQDTPASPAADDRPGRDVPAHEAPRVGHERGRDGEPSGPPDEVPPTSPEQSPDPSAGAPRDEDDPARDTTAVEGESPRPPRR